MSTREKSSKGRTSRRKAKFVLIGAASASFGPRTIVDIFVNEELKKLDAELVLVDVDEANLQAVFRFGEMAREAAKSDIRLSMATDRCEALPGANFVITSVARRRNELWELDFRVPLAMGFKHVLGENGGPGAVFHTMRSFELMVPIARDIERLAPRALLLNFTNPESRVCLAVSKLTKVEAVGLCHGVMGSIKTVANILGKSDKDLRVTVGGINHFHWLMKIEDAESGKDLYPALRRKVDAKPEVFSPLVRMLWDVLGLIPFPVDNHIGEYLSFAHEFYGSRLHWGRAWRAVPAAEPPHGTGDARERLAPYLEGKTPLDDRVLRRSGEIAVDIACDVVLDLGRREPSVNVPNRGGAVENLPEDAIVEVAAVVDRKGVHPERVGPLPMAIAELCRRQTAIQELLVEAYRTGSRKLLLQALLLDPVVDSVSKAQQLIDDMLRLQADFLPTFK
jgi:alpha-galactosidase